MFKLRDYQKESVDIGIDFLENGKSGDGGVIVAPTGSGKSLIIAGIAQKVPGSIIVFQPNIEILEQNMEKLKSFGFTDIGVFSASAGRKDISKVTFATIGTIYNNPHLWNLFDKVIIDEAHNVNAKEGMYKEFLEANGKNVLGLTATPFRLHSVNGRDGEKQAVVKMITRTRPRIFTKILYVIQIEDLYKRGYLSPVRYIKNPKYRQSDLRLNSTGLDFDLEYLSEYNKVQRITDTTVYAIEKANAKHILVFTMFVDEAEDIASKLRQRGVSCETVSAKTPKQKRREILYEYKKGNIKVVTNVGTLTSGFDFPELDCVILARPTQSVSLYYQMVGRGIRTAEGKGNTTLIDLCGNVDRFGKIESFVFVKKKDRPNLVRLRSDSKYLTGFDFISNTDLERQGRSPFD